jgi:Arc/MetJ family transcription regulator
MRIALNLDDQLVEDAKQLSGITGTSAVVRAGLQRLIAREAARRLAALGGTDPDAAAGVRRRPGEGSTRSGVGAV